MEATSSTLTREELEDRELRELAPYARKARESSGRQHPEEEHPYRTAYQRDRDRIIHCSAFRRLEYKTQVFVNTYGDYYRTRLTHSMEAAQISRTVGRARGLNEDLCEVVALSHDAVLDPPPSLAELSYVKGVTDDAQILLDGAALLDSERLVIDQV